MCVCASWTLGEANQKRGGERRERGESLTLTSKSGEFCLGSSSLPGCSQQTPSRRPAEDLTARPGCDGQQLTLPRMAEEAIWHDLQGFFFFYIGKSQTYCQWINKLKSFGFPTLRQLLYV